MLFLGLQGKLAAQEQSDGGIRFLDNEKWESVVALATEQGRKVFVDCYTSWCGPCKLLAKEVFTQKEVGDFFNVNFVNVKYDMEKPAGVEFGKKYKGEVVNYPTMLVIDPVSGDILCKIVGRRSSDELMFEARKGLECLDVNVLTQRYENGECDYAFIKDYVLSLDLAGEREQLVEVIDDYFKRCDSFDQLLEDGEKWRFFSQYLYDLRSDFFQYVIKNYVSLSFKPYVEDEELRRTIARCLYAGIESLLKIDFQDGHVTDIMRDSAFVQMLKRDLQALRSFEGREQCVALLKVYEQLQAREWEKAFTLFNCMRDFEMERAVRFNYVPVCLYLASHASNRRFLEDILENLRSFQKEEERKIPHFNCYDGIAFVQECLGDVESAKASKEIYEKLVREKKMQFSKKKK